MKSSKAALATHLGIDMSEMKDYSYQPGRFTRSVYYVENAYWCSVKETRHLPKATRLMGMELEWKEVPDKHVNGFGWKVFTATHEV